MSDLPSPPPDDDDRPDFGGQGWLRTALRGEDSEARALLDGLLEQLTPAEWANFRVYYRVSTDAAAEFLEGLPHVPGDEQLHWVTAGDGSRRLDC